MVKKWLLGILVLASFVIYSVHTRQETQETAAVPVQPNSNTPTALPAQPMSTAATRYADGAYVGPASNAFYGFVQVKAIISGGKLTDVVFLDYPSDRDTSRQINRQAIPYLKQEAIQAQSAAVDGVSGATDTSQAFIESLTTALQKAQHS